MTKNRSFVPGKCNISNACFVEHYKIFLPPLRIKIALIKIFVNALVKSDSGGFKYIIEVFLNISFQKINEGVFHGPQIREMLRFEQFECTLNEIQKMPG